MGYESPIECAYVGCHALRRTVNHWYVVEETPSGAHIHRWADCSEKSMKNGKPYCGLSHAFLAASNILTPDTTVANRESTLELKPPLNREGLAPEAKEDLEPTPGEPEEKGAAWRTS